MSTIEEQLVEARMKEYAEAAKTGANVDKAALALAALDAVGSENLISAKRKKWLYLLSLGLPPIGLFFAAWYYFSPKKDGKHVALVCVIITAISALVFWLTLTMFFSLLPPQTLQQVQTLNPSDLNEIKDLLQ
jgi:RsiW-degrading membrane proteinase PrsW (M82 family)